MTNLSAEKKIIEVMEELLSLKNETKNQRKKDYMDDILFLLTNMRLDAHYDKGIAW